MDDLIIPIKGEYFHEIRTGRKLAEYRRITPYWQKRLKDREYDRLIFTLGYPKGGGVEGVTRLTMPYRGYEWKQITHPHFGPSAVGVYAINVAQHERGSL